MPFPGMKEQVPQACGLPPNGRAQADRKQKRKAKLRQARRGALATACLLIGVCVFSVLDPVLVRAASGYVSRARAWVGNVLKLDDAMGMPPPSDFQSRVEETPVERGGYKTVEEIGAAYGLTVYEPTQIPGGGKPGSVEAFIAGGGFVSLRYRYDADGAFLLQFAIEPKGDSQQLSFPEDAFLHAAPAGEFSVFEAVSGGWYAVAITQESIVSIHGKMDKDAFLNTLDTLRAVY